MILDSTGHPYRDLSDEDLDRQIEAYAGDAVGGESLDRFIRRITPRHPPPAHIAPLMRLIERTRYEPVRAAVMWPPRHAKTTTILNGLAWILAQNPADRCAYASYAESLARSKSRLTRGLARAAGLELANDSAAVTEWSTKQGGGLVAAGLQGGFTGKGVNGLFVVDDAVKGRKDADSPVMREANWDAFNEVVYTRLEPGASVIVSGTRWHDDDLIGRLEQMGGWEIIRLPALAEDDEDPMGRPMGAALWPEMYPVEALDAIRRQIGEWSFAALYQQRPRPRGAILFGDPHVYEGPPVVSGFKYIIGADPAASENTRADYSAAVVQAVRGAGPKSEGRVIEVVRRQCTVPAFVQILADLSNRYTRAKIAVEAVAGFKAVPQMLRQLDPKLPLVEVNMGGDKFLRAQACAAAWNDGRLLVPRSALWLRDFLDEVTKFTGARDRHDDQVDALAHGWNAMVTGSQGIARMQALTST